VHTNSDHLSTKLGEEVVRIPKNQEYVCAHNWASRVLAYSAIKHVLIVNLIHLWKPYRTAATEPPVQVLSDSWLLLCYSINGKRNPAHNIHLLIFVKLFSSLLSSLYSHIRLCSQITGTSVVRTKNTAHYMLKCTKSTRRLPRGGMEILSWERSSMHLLVTIFLASKWAQYGCAYKFSLAPKVQSEANTVVRTIFKYKWSAWKACW